jgi:oxygen-independent coproporphyrinogen-3 oxidase
VPFGIYLHVPFCASRCDYCAFATWTDRHHLIGEYLEACRRQAAAVAVDCPPVTSVFVGGGTPSQVPPEGLMAVLGELPVATGAEITVECNPDDVTSALVDGLAAGGVNRISMGVQSMVPSVLTALGRTHRPEHVPVAVEAVRAAGIADLNLDLIYGGAGESLDDWAVTLDAALVLEPDHVSAYGLTVEPGTPLWADPTRYPDDDDQADKYVIADDRLAASGLENYEVSNWARPGHECRHNLLYWRQQDYVGLGCAAHSHVSGRRWWSVRTPERFIAAITDGTSPEAGWEQLDAPERRLEALQLELRTRDGVPVETVPDEVRHLVEVRDERARLTREGRLLANEVAVRLQVEERGERC